MKMSIGIYGNEKTVSEVKKILTTMEHDELTLQEAEDTVTALYEMFTNVNHGRIVLHRGLKFIAPQDEEIERL